MPIQLRPYQEQLYVEAQKKLQDELITSICIYLPTGGGKSVVIGKFAEDLEGRTLVLTHRTEILKQNYEWLNSGAVLTATENTLRYDSRVVIGMVETVYARIQKYGEKYLGDFDNIILDEVHVLTFQKVFEKFSYKKLIGFTGTPVINKKKYFTVDGVEFVTEYTLSELFDDLVQVIDTQDLIDLGYLVQDYNIVLQLPDFDKLKESNSNPDGYTTNSLNDVYANSASLKILNQAISKHCKGKKTIIFNATTKVNKYVYEHLKKYGLNVKMYDSVNKTEETRKDVVEWFQNQREAILINTNVFTTGFNVTDVEVIIVNRATKSLSLWIQMVGRGSRTTNKIYKDHFTVIDLGQNIHEHGIWSIKRNWKDYFYPPPPKPKKKMDLLDVWECSYCGAFNVKGLTTCQNCNSLKSDVEIRQGKSKKLKDGELKRIGKIPLPSGKKIVDYTLSLGENANFAFKLAERRIVELFIHYQVTKEFYEKNREPFIKRVKEIYRPIYFSIINSDLDGANKTLNKQYERINKKIDKMYNMNEKDNRIN